MMEITSTLDVGQQVTINESGAKGKVIGFALDEASTLWVRVRRIGENAESDYFLEMDLTAG